MNTLKKVLLNLLWVLTYPINVLTGARSFGSHNERLAARPRWLVQAFVAALVSFQLTYWLLPLFVRMPDFIVPLTVLVFTVASHVIGGSLDSKESGDAFSRAKRPPMFQSSNTARQIVCCGIFWAGVASLAIWWLL